MRTNVVESDWKHFKVIRESALQRLCERALADLVETAGDSAATPHERYLLVLAKIQEYARQLEAGFDQLSRSRMLEQIMYASSLGLIHDDEMAGFTQGLRSEVAALHALARDLTSEDDS